MVIRVLNDRSIVKDADPYGTQNENQVTTLNFVIPEEYASFNKKIVFITPNGVYWDLITNDTYIIKNNVTKYRNVSAYVWLVDVENQIDFRTKIFYIDFNQNTNPDNFIPSAEEISGYDTMIAELNELIQEVEDLGALHYEIVEELPTEDIDPTAVYLILREESEPNNIYDEWMYIESAWEKIGSTDIDLQPLQKEIDEINEMLFTHTTAESVNQEVSLNGNPNLEMNVTELDGRTEQYSTEGYQLANLNGMNNTTNNGVTFTINKENGLTKSVKVNGTSVDYDSYCIGTAYLLKAGTYTIYGNGVTNNIILQIVNDTQTAQFGYAGMNDNTMTLSQDTNIIIRIRVPVGATIDNVEIKPIIATTSGKSFEPYTNGASPNPDYPQNIDVVTGTQDVVVSGKNILGSEIELGGFNDDGTPLSGTSTYRNATPIPVKPNKQYIFSINGTAKNINKFYYDRNMNLISKESNVYPLITTPNNAYYLNIYKSTSDGDEKWQIVEGTEGNTYTLTYEPYYNLTKQVRLGDIELAKIGTYKDKIYPSGGKWYLHKEIIKIDITSSLNWLTSGNGKWWYFGDYMSILPSAVNSEIMSNYFIKGNWNSTEDREKPNVISLGTASNGIIGITTASFSSLDALKTFLDNNDVYAIAQRNTPTETEITDETLLADLNAIQKLQQLNGTTIVSIEGNLSADFKLVYENDSISDLNTRVGNIEADYVKSTDYASNSKGGVILPGWYYFLVGTDGRPAANSVSYADFQNADNRCFVSKGTLNNVLNAKIGDINSLLDEINGEVI